MRPESGLIDRKWELRLPKIRHEERETYLPWNANISRLSLVRETVSSEAEELEYQRAMLWICFDTYLDSTYHSDEDPDSDFYLMRIWILVRLFTLVWIRIQIQILASK
jgi:hypothetical protein